MLKIDNYTIVTPLIDILQVVRKYNPTYLNTLKVTGNDIMCTCPFHGHHVEQHPSCGINIDPTSPLYGTYHCFACDSVGSFYHLVAECFGKNDAWAKQWLIDNFGEVGSQPTINLPPIEIKSRNRKPTLDESILKTFENFHPYMIQRKLNQDIVNKFEVKYDPKTNCLVFPVRDADGKLVMLTRRSVVDKTFIIDKEKEKPVYLLYYILKNKIQEFMICESQIDALTAFSYGMPCCATMGQPSDKQIESINKSGVRILYTMFDNDDWGRKFTETVNRKLKKDIIVINVTIPYKGKKDINDLTKEEFCRCIEISQDCSSILV